MNAVRRIVLAAVIVGLAILPAAGQAAEFTFRAGVMNVAGHPGDLGAATAASRSRSSRAASWAPRTRCGRP
ncbi:MAG: hypothetical protein HYW08_03335 [candidate division NC10 bacterium]|nr:hypothetical protein [candidate division NC10 bacterium]